MKTDSDYFQKLKRLVLLEEKEEAAEVERELSLLGPEERELKGHALLDLVVEEQSFSLTGHFLISLKRVARKPLPIFSLEIGDVVRLVSRKEKFAQAPTGTIYAKTKNVLTIAFSKALPESFVSDGRYDLFREVNSATYQKMIHAVELVEGAKDTRLAHFRDISLGTRKSQMRIGGDERPSFFNDSLNSSQAAAVMKCLAAKDIALIHGPPGTGKTTVLIEIVRQYVKEKKRVFVTAPSNVACDNLLERLIGSGVRALRLGHPARIMENLREHTLDFRLVSHPLAQVSEDMEHDLDQLFKRLRRYQEKRFPGYEKMDETRDEISKLKHEKRELAREILKCVLTETEVFVGTPVSMMNREMSSLVFDILIFDEATQATEPLTWIPLGHAQKVVMAGDHFQLPPTVRSKEAEKGGLGMSLFERLYEQLGEEYKQLIEQQYRMNEKIMGFSSRVFYRNLLHADESVKHHVLADLDGVRRSPDTESPFLFLDTAGKGFEERLEEGSQSRYNPEEAELVLEELKNLLEHGVPANEIAVISPYGAQARLLESKSPHPEIEIGSVDGFQGREKELVIVSLVRSNVEGELGFLSDSRRMNVAMTRAKRKLIVIGDSATLSSIQFYKKFIEYAEEIGGYRSAWEH